MESLLPSGLRLARLAFDHPRCELRDCVRYHRSLLGALVDGDLERISQLIRAFSRREQDLALCVIDEAA
jgi:DNA-binding GntR family transcriptional regulator